MPPVVYVFSHTYIFPQVEKLVHLPPHTQGIVTDKIDRYAVSKRCFDRVFSLFELKIGSLRFIKKLELLLSLTIKAIPLKDFWKMRCGEDNLFSKRYLPRKAILQQPLAETTAAAYFSSRFSMNGCCNSFRPPGSRSAVYRLRFSWGPGIFST